MINGSLLPVIRLAALRWLILSGILTLWLSAATPADIVINEIHYDPPVKTELAEFIELHNSGASEVNLDGWQFSAGVSFVFPAGSRISAGGYLVVAENPAAFRTKFGGTALGPWTGLLAGDGERIELKNSAGEIVDEVDYQLGFPWPTVGDPPGYSIELIHPSLDNDLGGSWRRSVRGNPATDLQTLIPQRSQWKYKKGTAEPSSPVTAWRDGAYDDAAWAAGAAPIGYDPSVSLGTTLGDMRGSYSSVYLRRKFQIANPNVFGSLSLEALYDDGIQVWINGQRVVNASLPNRNVAYNELATGAARESADYDPFVINSPAAFLRAGENVITVQLHNVLLSDSSDCYVDLILKGQVGSPNSGPTPGARNAVYDTNLPPHLRQVAHSPEQPKSGEPVRITAKITDADGVSSAELLYQLVDPGSYIDLADAAYAANWTSLPMRDDGLNGDERAADSVYTALLPASLQTHRRLVRYRIVAQDAGQRTIRAPYEDDPEPNFAYFVYDGVPAWQAAIQPGSANQTRAQVQTYSAAEMGRLPAYHLLAKKSSVEDATWNSRYGGDLYRWGGTLVYDGKVYDHIRYRMRGGVWRYAMGKNMWKFDLNRGHDFEPRDNYGKRYKTKWRKINLGAAIQQGDYEHRGEQGMFESVGFRLFNLAGVESPKAHWITLRIIDDAVEASQSSQYNGDFWGLYLAIEQEDGRFLDEHDLPDGNLYKMEGGTGELNNQGRTAATDKSDLNAFLNTYRSTTPSESWWRTNFDIAKYFNYQAIVQGIHHYDICYGKNYFYFLNPETRLWAVHTWDLDLTWADNMFDAGCGGRDDFLDRVALNPIFNREYRNRVREIRDLLFNNDEAWRLLDEYAGIVRGTNSGPNILAADRSQWDYHPVMNNGSIVNLSKAGHGRYYTFPLESANRPALRGSFEAGVQIMKNYVTNRAAVLDNLARDTSIPARPTLTYTGPANFPANRVTLQSSAFSGAGGFAAMKWRVGEVRAAAPGVPGIYEIEPLWESPEISVFSDSISIPAGVLKVGHAYRARVRMKDATGRWSNWSAPLPFTAGEPDNSAALQAHLRVSEIMYHPPAGSDAEFIELRNSSADLTLQLEGAAFTSGLDFVFPPGAALVPGELCLLARGNPTNNFAAFRARYNLPATAKIFGPYDGSLNNDGERLTLKTAASGAEIFSFAYNDRAGWPIAPDGAGHSLRYLGQGALEYPGNWTASTYLGGTPLTLDGGPRSPLRINEFEAHTDYSDPARPEYDSNDWIELINSGDSTIELGDYYLSDDAADLKKWRLPNATLPARSRVTFDEIAGFHTPITTGFGLDKAGETLFLSHLPGVIQGQSLDRVADAIRFKAQENFVSFGRYPDGGDYLYRLNPTRNAANTPAPVDLVISEIMFHPASDTNAWQEYIEIYNAGTQPAPLSNTNGPFRIDGGISFTFPPNLIVNPGNPLILVSFDPANTTLANDFKSFYGLANSSLVLAGPFTGRLGNSSDRIALEKPEAPDLPGQPVSWVIIDEAIYTADSGANGTGESLHRASFTITANDPANLRPGAPTPGSAAASGHPDRDGDGLPNDWEIAYGLDPDSALDAALDQDRDGLSNRDEYLVGTNPADAASRFDLDVIQNPGSGATLQFQSRAGRSYTILYRENLGTGAWRKLRDLTGTGEILQAQDFAPAELQRYYRLVTPAQP